MATPSNRIPVRVARGTKANIDIAVAAGDLKEGEIIYVTDENAIYVIEGGVLTQAGADLSASSLSSLSDVDTTTVAPTDGQVLIWNSVDGEWVPGDAVSEATPVLTWSVTAGDGTDYTIEGPGFPSPASDPALYVVRGQKYIFDKTFSGHAFELQDTGGTTYTSGVTGTQPISGIDSISWVVPMDAPSELKYQCTAHPGMTGPIYVLSEAPDLSATSIDSLSDVDTTTAAPSDGQALVWSAADGEWQPNTVSAVGSIDDLSDVDTTTAAPTDGQVLAWDNTASQWEPTSLGGTTGTTSVIAPFAIAYINTASAGSGTGMSWGAYDSGTGNITITFDAAQPDTDYIVVSDNEEVDDVGVQISSKTTSGFTAGTYDFSSGNPVSPATRPFSLQVFASNPVQTFFGSNGASIDDLSDVDTTTAAPTDGQALVWSSADGEWQPGTVSGGGAVTSVNTLTGDVSLGIQEMDDFELNPAALEQLSYSAGHSSGVSAVDANGEFSRGTINQGPYPSNSKALGIYAFDDNGDSIATLFAGYTDADPVWVSNDGGGNWTQYATVGFAAWIGFTDVYALLSDGLYDDLSTLVATPMLITLQDPSSTTYAPLAEDNILQWDNAASKFKPALLATVATSGAYSDLTGAPTAVSSIDDLSDVDTTTAAPTDGQALVWSSADSEWQPGSVAGGVSSVNGETGVVSLQATDITDIGLASAPPTFYKYDTTVSCTGTTTADDNPGGARRYNADAAYSMHPTDSDGVSLGDRYNAEGWGATPVTITVWVSTDDGANWTSYQKQAYRASTTSSLVYLLDINGDTMICSGSGVWFSYDDPTVDVETPVADGDVLKYNATDAEYQPTALATVATTGAYSDLTGAPTAVSSIDDLSDVDTTTVAPTDGDLIQWVDAESKWKPVQIASVNGGTFGSGV